MTEQETVESTDQMQEKKPWGIIFNDFEKEPVIDLVRTAVSLTTQACAKAPGVTFSVETVQVGHKLHLNFTPLPSRDEIDAVLRRLK